MRVTRAELLLLDSFLWSLFDIRTAAAPAAMSVVEFINRSARQSRAGVG